jgi:hypothetical protein
MDKRLRQVVDDTAPANPGVAGRGYISIEKIKLGAPWCFVYSDR